MFCFNEKCLIVKKRGQEIHTNLKKMVDSKKKGGGESNGKVLGGHKIIVQPWLKTSCWMTMKSMTL